MSKRAISPAESEAVIVEAYGTAGARLDKDAGVIFGAKFFGPTQRDGEYYVSESGNYYAPGFHESLAAAINKGGMGWGYHPSQDAKGGYAMRPVIDAIAKPKNASVVTESGFPTVRGDYHFVGEKKAAYVNIVAEGADTFGLSAFAHTIQRYDAAKGKTINVSVNPKMKRNVSVDIVEASGATGRILESVSTITEPKENVMPDQMTAEQLDEKIKSAVTEAVSTTSATLQKKIDEAMAESAVAKRQALVQTKLAASGLKAEYVKPSLRAMLESSHMTEAQIDALLTDLKATISESSNPVKGLGAGAHSAGTTEGLDISETICVGNPRGLGTIMESLGEGRGVEPMKKAAKRWTAEIAPFLYDTKAPHHRQPKDFKWDSNERLAIFESFANTGLKQLFKDMTGVDAYDGMMAEAVIASSSYTIVTGSLLGSKMIESYNVVKGLVGDDLVTVYPSKLLAEKFPGFDAAAGIADVAEGAKYPDATIAEKYVGDTTWSKRGVMVQITEEAILFDQTGMLLMRANQIGNSLRVDREKLILTGIQDTIAGGAYWPSGAASALYVAGNTVDPNPLTDVAALELANTKLMLQTDSNGDIIAQDDTDMIVLVPAALYQTARKVIQLTELRFNTAGGNMMVGSNPWGATSVVKSGYLDSVSAGNWYYGSRSGFRNQFILKSHFPFRVIQVNPAEVSNTTKDIVGGVVARWKERVFALDNKAVIKNKA